MIDLSFYSGTVGGVEGVFEERIGLPGVQETGVVHHFIDQYGVAVLNAVLLLLIGDEVHNLSCLALGRVCKKEKDWGDALLIDDLMLLREMRCFRWAYCLLRLSISLLLLTKFHIFI